MPILSRNMDKISIETVFRLPFVASGATNRSKTLFLSIFDPRSSIVDNVFNCRLSGLKLVLQSGPDWYLSQATGNHVR